MRHFPNSAFPFSWLHDNRKRPNVAERNKHNYTVTGHIYMNYVSFATLHTTSYIQLASAELHLVFRSSKTIMKLLKMAATVRFMKLMFRQH